MKKLLLMFFMSLAFTVSAEDLGKTYADQGWAMFDRLEQGNYAEDDSYDKAFELLNEAASYGNKAVYNTMGYICQHHSGTLNQGMSREKYASMIEDYYNKAIGYGNTNAIYNLATCYQQGDSYIGFERNLNKAIALFRMGAAQGNAYCLTELGQLYKRKDIEAIDNYPEVAAFECYNKAYETQPNSCPAICLLAECYEKGEGVSRDETKAFSLYLEGSEYNDYAAAKVGLFYEEGRIVEKDLQKAYEYYEKATANCFLEEWITQHHHHVGYLLGKEDTPYYNEIETVSPAVRSIR